MMSSVFDNLPWERLVEVAPVAISVIDPLGRQVGCNRAYADLLGYSIEELARVDVGRITRDEDHEWTRSYLTQLTSGELDEFVTEKVYVRKDGSEFTARLTACPLHDEDGNCSMLLATIVPVDARPPISARGIQRLLEFTTDTVTIIDADGSIRETTGQDQLRLGYPSEFWNTRSVLDVVEDHEVVRLVEFRDRLLADPATPVETEIEVRAADGSGATLAVVAANHLEDPDIQGIVLTTRNITDHLQTLSELAERRDTAEAVADAQIRLLATVSHELRNPLHAVQGLAELLTEDDLPPVAAELAETLRRQLSSLTQVTQDLLDASRFDAGETVIAPEPTNLRALVSDVAAVGRSAAAGKSVVVSSHVAADVPDWLMVDGDRLRQVLTNLVGNAVKFTPDGTVELVVRGVDGSFEFSVIDTGVGIPAHEQDAVLEPFRVASTGGTERGAGLGLSIVDRIVGAMEGRVVMTSETDRGTRFDVVLPIEPTAPPGWSAVGELETGLRVLVVEDNPVNQQLARSQLERLGHLPTVVGSGEQALELLDDGAASSIDVVLMDHQLPGISGLETTRLIRERTDAAAAIPIVGLSASASRDDADAFLNAGMNDFIAKPASLNQLSTAIAQVRSTEAGPPAESADITDEVASDLDHAVLAQLVDDLGDHVVVAGLVRTFLDELDTRVDAIVTGLEHHDRETAKRAAHTLKSSARLLGAIGLADACQAIEQDGRIELDVTGIAERARGRMRGWLDGADRRQ